MKIKPTQASGQIFICTVDDDDDFVGFRSLLAQGIHVYGTDHKRERIGYKEIHEQAPSSFE